MKKQTILGSHLAESIRRQSFKIEPKLDSIYIDFLRSNTQCTIDDSGIVLNYDLAGDERFTYAELENQNKIQYLGVGMVYRVNGALQHMNPFQPKQHFWVWNNENN